MVLSTKWYVYRAAWLWEEFYWLIALLDAAGAN